MADKLGKKLDDIETKLGGSEFTPDVNDKLGSHLDYIESLIEEGSGGSEVVANPEDEATENLNKLKVEDVTYAIPNGLPDTEGSVEGQVLKLDSELNPTWSYDSDSELPSTEGASEGDVLKIGQSGLEWGTSIDGIVVMESSNSLKNIALASADSNIPSIGNNYIYKNLFVGGGTNSSSIVLKTKSSSYTLRDNFIIRPCWNATVPAGSDIYMPVTGNNNVLIFDGNATTNIAKAGSTYAENSYLNMGGLYNCYTDQFRFTNTVVPYFYGREGQKLQANHALIIWHTSNISGSNKGFNFNNSICNVAGTVSSDQTTTYFGGNGSQFLGGSALIACNPKFIGQPADSGSGLTILGNYPIYDINYNSTDRLIVGAGTSSANSNCFATGNDGTDDYIKVGDTKVTETQMSDLVSNPIELNSSLESGETLDSLSTIRKGNDIYGLSAMDVQYLTTAPTADNTSGRLQFVVLDTEPATYYDGYYYIITGSN